MGRVSRLVLGCVGALVAATTLVGCGCDDIDCSPATVTGQVAFEGQIVERDGALATFRTPEGDLYDVEVGGGPTWPLRPGRSFAVVANLVDGTLRAELPGGCPDCGADGTITHLDGSPVATGSWARLAGPLTRAAALAAAGLLALGAVWGMARTLARRPHGRR